MDTTGGEMERENCLVENPRQRRGRKKLKQNEKKKEKKPMRGMGVAKLEEHLRLTGQQKSPPPPVQQQPPILPSGHHFFLPPPDPTRTGYGYLDLNNALWVQRVGYAGLTGGGDHGPGPAQVRVGFGGNLKELSSIPNPVRYPGDQCCFCHKKTRVNGGSLGCNGMREKYCDPSLINGFSFNGFNVGNNQPIHGSSVDKGVEAVGIHTRNESSSRAFMEYDFFPPGKGGRGTCTNDLDLSLFSEASVGGAGGGGGGEGSCVTTTTASAASSGFDASTSIDLSLKLYC